MGERRREMGSLEQHRTGVLDGNALPVSGVAQRGAAAALPSRWADLRSSWFGDRRMARIVMASFAVLFLVVLAAGLLIVNVLEDTAVGRTDRSAARALADVRSPGWESLAQAASGLSDALTLTPAVVVLVVFFVLRFRRWQEALLLGGGLLLEKAVFITTTYLVGRERPPVAQLDGEPPTSSYPSGHVAAAVVLYGALAVVVAWHVRRPVIRALAVAMSGVAPACVAASRLYLGMHHVTDVVCGALLGAGALLCAAYAVGVGSARLESEGAPERVHRLSWVGGSQIG